MNDNEETAGALQALVEALETPDVFVREATGEKFMLIGRHLVAIKDLDPKGRPIIACESEEVPNADGGQDVIVRPQPLRCKLGAHEPGE